MIVISEATFSKEVVVEKLQVSSSVRCLPAYWDICSVNCGKIFSHERVGSSSFLSSLTIKDSLPEKSTSSFLIDS